MYVYVCVCVCARARARACVVVARLVSSTALFYAAEGATAEHEACVHTLLTSNADVSVKNATGKLAWQVAARPGVSSLLRDKFAAQEEAAAASSMTPRR